MKLRKREFLIGAILVILQLYGLALIYLILLIGGKVIYEIHKDRYN